MIKVGSGLHQLTNPMSALRAKSPHGSTFCSLPFDIWHLWQYWRFGNFGNTGILAKGPWLPPSAGSSLAILAFWQLWQYWHFCKRAVVTSISRKLIGGIAQPLTSLFQIREKYRGGGKGGYIEKKTHLGTRCRGEKRVYIRRSRFIYDPNVMVRKWGIY